MKQLTQPEGKKVQNAWGRDAIVCNTDYEIEADDVGRSKPHHGGNGQPAYKFTASDVGRTIREDSAPGGCWYFLA